MNENYSGRPIKIESHQFYAEGFLIEIGGLSEHGWFLVEGKNGNVHKYQMPQYCFSFTDREDKDVAAPRPSEPKELWGKIWEWLQTHRYDTDCAGKEIAKIAKEHYTNLLEGKEVEEALALQLDCFFEGLLARPNATAKHALQFIKERILQ